MYKARYARRSFLQLSARPYHYLHLVTTKAIILLLALISNLYYNLACLITLHRLNLNIGTPVLPHYYYGSLIYRVLNI